MALSVDIIKNLPGFQLAVSVHFQGGILGLLGPSGSGKSMTLRCIAGLQTPDKGRIAIGGQVLYDAEKGINLPPQQRKVGFLFQNYALFPHLTVKENISLGLRGIKEKEKNNIIREMVTLVKLEGLAERYPHQLSGGQQQRVALARALAPRPRVLLLDEPFSALDNHLRGEMEQELSALLKTFPGTAIFVTHKLDEAYRLCPELIILGNGKVKASGHREAIFSNPPNLAVARMMGCQNLSRIRSRSNGTLEALDWGCLLRLPAKKVRPGAEHVGIYSNYIRLAGENDNINNLNCRVLKIIESPHYVTLDVRPANRAPANQGCIKITWPKEKWRRLGLQKDQILKLYLPPERLFLTRD
jgi:molybdate transport system ATP-binding protein